MEFINTKISDVVLIKPTIFEDTRGSFMETYHFNKYSKFDIDLSFVQDNHVKSYKNVLRGLHFQNQFPQAKLLRCIKGKIFDVAVDLRKKSPSFASWIGVELSEQNQEMLFIPEGFAHGYYVMSDSAEVVYKCSQIYYSNDQYSLQWNDPDLGIKWPCNNPILSKKDEFALSLNELKIKLK